MGLDIGGFFDDVGNTVKSGLSSAAEGTRQIVNEAASKMFDEAYDVVEKVTPSAITPALRTMRAGTKNIYTQAVEYLDPVTFAVESLSDYVGSTMDLEKAAFKLGEAIFTGGDVSGTAEKAGKSLLNHYADKGLAALSLIPSGKVAGAVTKPVTKSMKKEAKAAVKAATTREEKKTAKKAKRITSVETKAISNLGRTAAIVGKREARKGINDVKPGKQFITKSDHKDRGKFKIEGDPFAYLLGDEQSFGMR